MPGCSLVDVPDLSRNYGVDASFTPDSEAGGEASSGEAGAADADADGVTYEAVVRADNPIAYYRLGEKPGVTTAVDDRGFAPAVYAGSCALGAPGLVVGADTAVTLDGETAGIDAGKTIDFSQRASFSFELWLEPGSIGATNQTLFAKDGEMNGRQEFGAYLNSTEGLVFERWVEGNPFVATVAAGTLKVGVPQHVVLTYDGSQLVVYVDGNKVASKTDTRAQAPKSGNLTFGFDAASGGKSFFRGVLDEIAVYSRALGEVEVTRHHEAGLGALRR